MLPGLQGIAGMVNQGPVVRYLGQYSSTTDRNGTAYPFTIALGSESPDRLIVVTAGAAAENSGGITGATIDSVNTTIVASTYFQNTDRGSGAMFSRAIANGSSASLLIQHNGSPTYSIVVDVFSITGLKSHTPVATAIANGTANSLSTTVNTAINGVLIAVGGGWGTSLPYTWIGATKVSELNSGDGGAQLSSAMLEGTLAQTGRTISWSTPSSGSRRVLLAAAWN